MKIIRSSKCSLKFSNNNKLFVLRKIISEYGKVVNYFINKFWKETPGKMELYKDKIECNNTWLTSRLRGAAAREAIGMILSVKNIEDNNKNIPIHNGNKMIIPNTIIKLHPSNLSKEFDIWIHLSCIGKKIILDLPIKLHKHFYYLLSRGKRLNSCLITKDYIQFYFEIETGPKKNEGELIGIDTGINSLASTSNGQQFGTDIKACIERIKRCKHGSKGQKRARRAARQRINEIAKEVVGENTKLLVVENLKNLNKNSKVKHRLTKNMRRAIGSWTYSYWLEKLQRVCEDRRSSFRSVSPYNTSIICSSCGYIDRSNRSQERFLCQKCGYVDNADINAAKNILDRFLIGPYGADFKPKILKKEF